MCDVWLSTIFASQIPDLTSQISYLTSLDPLATPRLRSLCCTSLIALGPGLLSAPGPFLVG